jgi:exodeoxyribonuclease VIII
MAAEKWKCSAEEYHAAHDHIGHSMLETFRKCIPLYKRRYIDGQAQREETPSLRLGTILHASLLEPDTIAIAPPCDRRTKAGKAIWEEFQADASGKLIITIDEHDAVEAMLIGIRSNPAAVDLLTCPSAEHESSYRWKDDTGLWLKCRFDVLLPTGCDVSLKTSSDPAPAGFAKAIANYGYHRQAAHYLSSGEATRHVFVVVRNCEPYDCYVYELDPYALEQGARENRETLKRLSMCYAFDNWQPEGFGTVQPISLPQWAMEDSYV